ncbi:UNVERIFIED_CONTAM: histone H3, partial [Eudyptes robustus]
ASQNSTTSGVLTQSQIPEKSLIVKRPQVMAMKVPKMDSGIRKRKYRPGTRALMEIRKLQKTCHLLIRRAPFLRVVKDIVRNCSKGIDYKIQSEAVNALQEASEAFLVTLFEAANMCAIHGKRVTVMPQDLLLVKNLLSLFN